MKAIVAKRKWRYPLSYERDYAKKLRAYVDRKFKIIKVFLPEMIDAIKSPNAVDAHIEIVIDQIKKAVENAETMSDVINRTYQVVDRYNDAEFNAIMGSVFGNGVQLIGQPMPKHTDAVDDLAELKALWIRENLDLIKSIDEETLRKLKRAMTQAVLNNVDKGELTKYLISELQAIAGVTRSRAALIGTDQVGKLNGRLSQYRQEHAGLTSYIWETCQDSRVRMSHSERQGRRYYWNNPPPDGHPGMPIRCRCVALPIIDLENIPIRPQAKSYILIGNTFTLMAHHAFKPSLARQEDTIKIKGTGKEYAFKVHKVKNSNFSLYADITIRPRDKIIRTIEQLLSEATLEVRGEVEFPTVVVTDLNDAFHMDIIGGYDFKSGKLFLSSRYDTKEKILAYIHRYNTGDVFQFANQTAYAPILHELGHKFYYDIIKKIAKIRKLEYNESKNLVDTVVSNWSNELLLQDKAMDKILSRYARDGMFNGQMTEVVAEAFSVNKTNQYAKKLIARLKGLVENDDSAN